MPYRSLLAALVLAACGKPAAQGPLHPARMPSAHDATPLAAPAAAQPKLVVLLVLDQWPEWAFDAKRADLHAGGFDRLLAEGAWHTGRHPSGATLTSPGHALLGSGEPTAISGILANEWWHRDVSKRLKSTEAEDGSPTNKWLRVPGLGDSIAAANTGAKAVSVSLKDRAAILTLGHAGTAVWYDSKRAAWTSFQPVPWVDDWNRTHPVSAHLHDVWKPRDRATLAGVSGREDNQPGELGEKGFGATFPHDPQATKDPADAVFAMPLGNDLTLEMATHAIEAEKLGADAAADLLVVSLSAHDYVGHGWGQESWEMWDLEMRLDARLAQFMTDLDRLVGKGEWAMVVTSDHGASPLPERMPKGGRIDYEAIEAAANHAAEAELGDGKWVAMAKYPTLWLSADMLAQPVKDRDVAIKKMVYALRSFPGLARVGRTDELTGNCDAKKGDWKTMCLALDPERSGEIAFFPAEGWILQEADERVGTAHGSLWDYDRIVPLIVLAPGRTAHDSLAAHDGTEIPMAEVAGMLASWLRVTPPAQLTPP